MLPKFLYSTYRRYKADTSTFIDWLVTTGRKCGYEASVNKPYNDDTKVRTSQSAYNSRVTVEELRKVARIIIESAGNHVPQTILATAKRAVSMRKRCANWYAKSRPQKSEAAVDGHSHFVTILEEICTALEAKAAKAKAEPDEKPTIARPHDENPNIAVPEVDVDFATLSLKSHAKLESSDSSANEETHIEIEEGNDDQDTPFSLLLFSIFCLFEDLRSMREFIADSLDEYLEGKIDLMNLAVTTDTAVKLAKDLIDEMLASWPQLNNDQMLQAFIYEAACACRGEDCEARPDSSVPYNSRMSDIAEWCYLPVLSLLCSFKDVLEPGYAPIAKRGVIGTYDAKAQRANLTTAEKFEEDKVLLLELLPEFALLARLDVELPVDDEITRGFVRFANDTKITPWLCFSAQILLDVHQALRYSNDKAFSDLRLTSLRFKKTIEEYWAFSKTFKSTPKFWPKECETYIKEIHACLEAWAMKDCLYQVKQKLLPEEMLAGGVIQKHHLFKSNAILAGLTMFHLTLRMQEGGLAIINQWYDVPQMAYLYNLAQQTGMRAITWPDMDIFIAMHGEEYIFVGGRPKTATESLKKLKLVTGMAGPSDFAKKEKENRSLLFAGTPGQHKSRPFEANAAIVNIFHDRYLAAGSSKMSLDNVDKLVKEISVMNSKPAKARPGTSQLRKVPNSEPSVKRLGALQLLAALKTGLHAAEPQLHFNYFDIHKRCTETFRLIVAKEHHKFVQYFTTAYMPDDTLICSLVVLVLTIAQGSEACIQQLGLTNSKTGGQGSRMVVSCEQVMKTYLQEYGDKNCKELKAFCKNKNLPTGRKVQMESKENWFMSSLDDIVDPASLAAFQTGIKLA